MWPWLEWHCRDCHEDLTIFFLDEVTGPPEGDYMLGTLAAVMLYHQCKVTA